MSERSRPDPPCLCHVNELGVFGGMAFAAVLQAGADPGYRHLRAHPGVGTRLAPHRALRHLIFSTLLNSGVLAPIASRRRLDDSVCDAPWEEDASLEDADWLIAWDEHTRGNLPQELRHYLDNFESTPRTREVMLQTWESLAIGECLAFGEYALAAHNLNPTLARSAAPSLATVLAQQSIGQGCALMWSAAKHLASWLMRNGTRAPGATQREFTGSICGNADRATYGKWAITRFSRHSSVPMSTFASTFMRTSKLGEGYWNLPLSEDALDRARPIGSGAVHREEC